MHVQYFLTNYSEILKYEFEKLNGAQINYKGTNILYTFLINYLNSIVIKGMA